MPTIMVLAAHPGDFVWRAAGTIAKQVRNGDRVSILCLTSGARGESPKLWTDASVTIEQVRAARSREAHAVADLLGAELTILDNEDFPLLPEPSLYGAVAEFMRKLAPEVVISHTANDPSNYDHVVAYQTLIRARMMVTSPGRGLATIRSPKLICFEPHYSEPSGFMPNLLIDITDTWELKEKAIGMTPSQANLWDYYRRLALQRGQIAGVKYAEAFQRLDPDVRNSVF